MIMCLPYKVIYLRYTIMCLLYNVMYLSHTVMYLLYNIIYFPYKVMYFSGILYVLKTGYPWQYQLRKWLVFLLGQRLLVSQVGHYYSLLILYIYFGLMQLLTRNQS